MCGGQTKIMIAEKVCGFHNEKETVFGVVISLCWSCLSYNCLYAFTFDMAVLNDCMLPVVYLIQLL